MSNISEELSDLSVEFEGDNPQTNYEDNEDNDNNVPEGAFGIEPYRFEPEMTSEDEESRGNVENSEEEEWRLNDKSW